MGVQQYPPATATWETEGYTTLRLERDDSGHWRVTQPGVDEFGHGPTAQRAAANYCRALAGACDD